MAAELLTPTDQITGMPHPIIPEHLDGRRDEPEINNHHSNHPAWMYRNNSPQSLYDYGLIAWRLGQMQYIDDRFHNNGPRAYHNFYAGPPLPTDVDKMFVGLMLTSAGYVSRQGIDLRSGEPVERSMQRREHEYLRTTDGMGMRYFGYGYNDLRTFTQMYALERGIGQVATSFLQEFVDPKTPQDRRAYLGHFILAQAAEQVSEAVRGPYQKALQAGLLHPATPVAPHALIRYKMGTSARRARLIPQLKNIITAQLT